MLKKIFRWGADDELDVVKVDDIEPTDATLTEQIVPASIEPMDPIEPLSRQPYRLSINIDPRHGCDKNEMYVPTSDLGRKKYCCAYCKKLVSKLVPHLENVHKNEKDVKAFKSLLPGE